MSELVIDGVRYESRPERSGDDPCDGCALKHNDVQCSRTFTKCASEKLVWVKAPVVPEVPTGYVPRGAAPCGGAWGECGATPPMREIDPLSAPALLDKAAQHMRDRAATYDKPEGERSMGKTVEAFNAITGRDLRESEGWLLLALLKMVRSEQRAAPHQDSIEDLIAYSALFGEARTGGK